MTKKHYIMLAEAIRLNTDSANKDYLHINSFVTDLVQELKKDNPAFDGYKFIDACIKPSIS